MPVRSGRQRPLQLAAETGQQGFDCPVGVVKRDGRTGHIATRRFGTERAKLLQMPPEGPAIARDLALSR